MLLITTTDHRATEQSTSGSLGDVSQVQNAAPQLYSHMFTQCPVTSLLTMSSTPSEKPWGKKVSDREAGY